MLGILDRLRVRGEVTFTLYEGDLTDAELVRLRSGLVIARASARVVRRNLVTDVARIDIVKVMTAQAGVTAPTHIALGNTVITPAATDTVLAGEFFRKVCSSVAPHQNYYARYVMNALTSEANATIKSAGLFNAAAAGRMWAIVSADIVKTSALSLVTEWKVQQLGV